MPAPSLFHGNKIRLRAFEPDDLPALQEYLNHPDLASRRYIPWKFSETFPLSRKQVEEIYQKWAGAENRVHFAVVLQETGELIGHAACDWGWDPHCPHVSVVIAPAHQRREYGSEVLDLLLHYLFEHTPAHNVSGWFADWNQPARAFARRHGFRENGGMRRAGIREGQHFEMITADILRPEWLSALQSPAARNS